MTPDFYVAVVLRDGRNLVLAYSETWIRGPHLRPKWDCLWSLEFPISVEWKDIYSSHKMSAYTYAALTDGGSEGPPSKDVAGAYLFECFEPAPESELATAAGVIAMTTYQTQVRDPRSDAFHVIERKAA